MNLFSTFFSRWTSPQGGVHPPDYKKLSSETPIHPVPLPPYLLLPLTQHIGAPPESMVEAGQYVYKGQALACCTAKNCPHPRHPMLHAPTSGVIEAVENRPVPHPSGLSAPCVVLRPDGKDIWQQQPQPIEHTNCTAAEISQRIAAAGIIGLGGAGFPAHLKIQHGSLHTLIINGAECEPYITCDDRLMRERADEIVQGAVLLARALGGIRTIFVGIEKNKPEAYAAMCAAAQGMAKVVMVPSRYPMGGERQLIHQLIGLEIPLKTVPPQRGVLVHNVGTLAAIFRAVTQGEPLISRVMTVTGQGVRAPGNVEVLIGTPVHHMLQTCGRLDNPADTRVIMGGPMMGMALRDEQLPIVKTSNCLIVEPQPQPVPLAMPCIRCGACERACPMGLLPQQLYWHSRAKDFAKAQRYHLFDCILCGCCAYVCPSHIPLVEYYRFARAEIHAQELGRKAAEKAKQRHQAKAGRLEREKAERKARHGQAAARTDTTGNADQDSSVATETPPPLDDAKKAAIAAAMARAKAKAAARQAGTPPLAESATPAQETLPVASEAENTKKAAILAAKAKAEARRAAKAQAAPTPPPVTTPDHPHDN